MIFFLITSHSKMSIIITYSLIIKLMMMQEMEQLTVDNFFNIKAQKKLQVTKIVSDKNN